MQSSFPIQLSAANDLRTLRQTLTGKIFLAISATALVAICAHISVPLYFTPVPITLQTMAVILVGLVLGPALGASALVLYLAEGVMGLPVFSPQYPGGVAHLLGPTAGYLLSYPIAAAAAGFVVRSIRSERFQLPAAILGGLAASVFIFAMGAAWIAYLPHSSAIVAWRMGVVPFLPGEVLKIAAAASGYTTFRKWRRS